MTARKATQVPVRVDLAIGDDELDELERPFVVQVGSRGTISLKSSLGFSLDDFYKAADLADQDPREVIDLLAADEASAAALRATGRGVLERVLKAWFASVGVEPGESAGSES